MKFRKTTHETVSRDLRAFASFLEEAHVSQRDRLAAAAHLNAVLDDMLGDDVFGTEGQCDPRGDHEASLNCRCYEIYAHMPNQGPQGLWSRHATLSSARRAYREAVNNRRGNHGAGTILELVDILDGVSLVLEREVVNA